MSDAGWQPIATAPRRPDVFILVFHPKYDTMHVARWDGGDENQFELVDERLEYLKDIYPTHWRPLPAPPALDGREHRAVPEGKR